MSLAAGAAIVVILVIIAVLAYLFKFIIGATAERGPEISIFTCEAWREARRRRKTKSF